jgi:hypothetical protein
MVRVIEGDVYFHSVYVWVCIPFTDNITVGPVVSAK